jgi:hypothetical protein
LATTFAGTATSRANWLEHLQSRSGQPQVGQIRPVAVE